MKMHLTAFLLTSLLVFSCADKKNMVDTTDKEPTGSVEEGSSKAPVFGGSEPADSLFFSMERTPCFGQCKAYRIKLYRSGYITFEGRANVEREGMHYARIGQDTLMTLLREAEKIQFFQLDDTYDSSVTDLPSSIIRIVADGKDKRVLARVGTPVTFKSFFTQAESLLFPLPWKPLPMPE